MLIYSLPPLRFFVNRDDPKTEPRTDIHCTRRTGEDQDASVVDMPITRLAASA